MKVLIAEDDRHTREGLVEIFEQEGFTTFAAEDGNRALDLFKKKKPDVVCLDIMMPGKDGYEVCRQIRKTDTRVGILFISAKSEEIDTVLGLELGADDYIVKPFSIKEVIARIRAVKRRLNLESEESGLKVPEGEEFEMGSDAKGQALLKVVPDQLRVFMAGNSTANDISARDLKLLRLFHENRGRVLDRNTIFDRCWGADYIANSRTLDQHISQLRKKIEANPRQPVIIQTVPGMGYRYE